MVIYFSGTGNSRFAAKLLSEKLGDELFDASSDIKAGKCGNFKSDKPLIFVSPIYAWRLPYIFSEYIKTSVFAGNKNTYFVLTCGSDIGGAGEYAEKLCLETGLNYSGIAEIVMPENFITMFKAPDKEDAVKIVKKAVPVLLETAELISRKMPLNSPGKSIFDGLKSGIVNSIFYKLFLKADPFYSKDTCTGCGACVRACPLNNISLKNSRPVWGKNCTQCMACICGCPHESIEYGRRSRGKVRYSCPEI